MISNYETASTRSALKRRKTFFERLHLDNWILLLLFIIATIGLFILYSASGKDWDMVTKQSASFTIGLLVMILVAQLSPSQMIRWTPVGYVLGIAMLIYVEFFGYVAKGSARWIDIPGVLRFQPSEFMKILTPAMLAWFLSKRGIPPNWQQILLCSIIVFIPFLLIYMQPDLGTSLLILLSGGFLLLIGGLGWRWILSVIALSIPTAIGMWFFLLKDYQKERVFTFLDPESNPLKAGWNIIQSKATLGSGGFFGKGWLLGTQSHLDFLPEAHTDFIVAVIGEEFGLIGVSFVFILYLALVVRW